MAHALSRLCCSDLSCGEERLSMFSFSVFIMISAVIRPTGPTKRRLKLSDRKRMIKHGSTFLGRAIGQYLSFGELRISAVFRYNVIFIGQSSQYLWRGGGTH